VTEPAANTIRGNSHPFLVPIRLPTPRPADSGATDAQRSAAIHVYSTATLVPNAILISISGLRCLVV
jgi:hypothetical protein